MLTRPVILYSGGCKVCRWLACNVIAWLAPTDLDIIPIRSEEGWTLLDQHSIPEDRRHLNWWFLDENGVLWQSDQGGALEFLAYLRPRLAQLVSCTIGCGGCNQLDQWVKAKRPQIAKHLPDVPAIKRINGEVTWHLG